jgi:anti-sigma regulatory factor (Ser/Thr protein kinase)
VIACLGKNGKPTFAKSSSLALELTIPSSSRFLTQVRHAVAIELRDLPRNTVDDVLLVLDEAVSNAIRHGSRDGGPVEIAVGIEHGWIDIRVRDHGPTPRLPRLPSAPPRTLATGGRGLWLIRQLVDEVGLRRAGRGTLLWARSRVAAAATLAAERRVRSAR